MAPSYAVSGSDSLGEFSGTYNNEAAGVFLLTYATGGGLLPAVPSNADGTLILSADSPPTDLPPAVKVDTADIWAFLGTALDDQGSGVNVAYYGNAATAQDSAHNSWLMKIRPDTGAVTVTDYGPNAHAYGTYNLTTPHLFQTGTTDPLPMPIIAVHPPNYEPWGLLAPPSGLPATFLVGGQIWRYLEGADGSAKYIGYITGQTMIVGTAESDGQRKLTITDSVNGDSIVMLNNARGSARLANGTLIYSGDYDGGRVVPTLDDANFYTIAADLDITGNVISLGSWADDPSVAGVSLAYTDVGEVGTLSMAMNRSAADWIWYRAANNTPSATQVPMMKLDRDHKLNLFAPGDAANPAVVLAPQPDAVSKIPKLELTNPPAASSAPSASVLTKGMADGRYLQSGGGGFVLGTLNGGVPTDGGSVAIGLNSIAGYESVSIGALAGANGINSPMSGFRSVGIGYQARPLGSNAIAIGHGTYAEANASISLGLGNSVTAEGGVTLGQVLVSNQVGQVVVGSYNLASIGSSVLEDTDDIFVVGNGTSQSNRSNAFVIKRNGDTRVMGQLTVDETLSVNGAFGVTGNTAVNGTFSVEGNTTVNGTTTLGGSTTVSGTLGVTGDTTVSGNSTISGNATVQQNLQVTGNGSVHGTLRVRAGGDIDMGTFTTSPAGMTAP